jgi:drug/metabolite transporter (DMT)-like permease
VILLGENITLLILLGIAVIFSGVVLISYSQPKNTSEISNMSRSKFRLGILFGIGAGFSWGIAPIFIRTVMITGSSPIPAALTSEIFGFLMMLIMLAFTGIQKSFRSMDKRTTYFLLFAGVVNSFAVLFSFSAFNLGPVVLVSPFMSISPLFTLILSHVLLRGVEFINLKNILGALMIVSGLYLIIAST